MEHEKFYITIDIGGTYARVSSCNSLTQPKFKDARSFELSHIFEDDFNEIIKTIKNITKNKITAIGIALPGTLNTEKSLLARAMNLPEWINQEIKNRLFNEFNCPIYLENDGVTSGLGEALYGNDHKEDFIFVIWGTGVGGSKVEVKPILKASQLLKEDYPQEIRGRLHGKSLLEKYTKPLNELSTEDWDNIFVDFGELLVYISNKLKIKNIVIGGGIALKQSDRSRTLSQKLKEDNNIFLTITNLGDSHTFGLYSGAALIAVNENS